MMKTMKTTAHNVGHSSEYWVLEILLDGKRLSIHTGKRAYIDGLIKQVHQSNKWMVK
jgi:hypothetical protein